MAKQKKLKEVPALELPELTDHLHDNHEKYRVSCADLDHGRLVIGDVKITRYPNIDPENQEQFFVRTDDSDYVVLPDRIYNDESDNPIFTGDAAQKLHQKVKGVYHLIMSYNAVKWEGRQKRRKVILVVTLMLASGIGGAVINNKISNNDKQPTKTEKFTPVKTQTTNPVTTAVYNGALQHTK